MAGLLMLVVVVVAVRAARMWRPRDSSKLREAACCEEWCVGC